jgi:hypothetical protein
MKIYLNRDLSEYFDVSYNNEKEETIIHTNALLRANKEWDTEHKKILSGSRDLYLYGAGFGWWEIIEKDDECNCSDPGCPCGGMKRGGEIR